MPNGYLDTKFVDKAIKFAVDAHSDTERRGKGFPYVIHVLEAMEIVATMSNDPHLLAAAALHDTVEDTDVTIDDIRREFGDRVAEIVAAESDRVDTSVDESKTWRGRKQAAIDRLSSASQDAKMVALGDKLSNIRAIRRDYFEIGDKLWDRFHAPGGKADHEWHYRGLAASLSDLSGTDAYSEFVRAVDDVFGEPAPELVDMGEYEQSGDGFTATSYNHRDGKRMVKMYSDFLPASTAFGEFKVSRTLEQMGLSIPKAFRVVTDGKRFGVEFERILEKKSFSRAIADDPDNLEAYARSFARMCLKLHSTVCNTSVLPPAEDRFLRHVMSYGKIDASQRSRIAGFIRKVPKCTTCVHGDLHIGNALVAGDRNYWIDLADFSYGNPLFDLGMMYFVCTFDESEELIKGLFHLSCAQMRRVWFYFADEYFGPDADKDEISRRLEPFAALYMVIFDDRDSIFPLMRKYIEDKLLAIC